ncbi:MAG: bifunctional riboflavin kinase/FAD synthetase [Nitrospirae bacterium]|nr:bifunctional riboflavin kinase/FAD synthetase [Nitrospirota bacterium]
MLLITDLGKITRPFTNSVITLGNFDGIHLGHQELVRMVMKRAQEIQGQSMVVTFRPHPLKVLAPDKCPPLISIYEEKIELFKKLGIDVLVKIPFSLHFAEMSPREFVKKILCDLLGTKEIFVGCNYRFGKGREGTTETLKQMGEEFGFRVNEVEQIFLKSELISSTKIRQLLRAGEVEHAAELLGRPYAITGIVVKGDSRGKTLGFPTANIASKHAIIPSNGVYAVKLSARDTCHDGVVNIGLRPTFETKSLAIEVHVFDFNEDLYGEEVTVYFIKKLRKEKKFDSADALIAQITKDIAEAKTVLAENPDCVDLSL